MALRRLLAGALAVGAALSVTPAQAQSPSTNPPGQITVEVQTVNGSGCPLGTADVATASDNTAFTVTYSDYLAQAGAGSNPIDFRKNCQLGLKFHIPQGFTYAIARADYRGFAYLQRGAFAQERASYYFQGMPQTARITHQFNGPYADNWQASDVTSYADLVWAPCGEERNLNVNTELRVYTGTSGPDRLSFMSMDSTDGSVSTKYHLRWKECPAT
ncbi:MULTISPECIES: DUF4360 domain-containing protein [unclassified Streptomyces]|uniref:DUF4360 domain-containing protein n=1 Tax=Streptomyces sp. NBC_00180 TaxID=2903632 RepID=A0AAU1I8Z0_9ACTN|nr:DUF4360 domain-containing protein [Streptomyces sp. NBC_01017]WSV34874.1 DUF4360 domain-containing protein [Streptomyces sp. NBC_01017]